ncbi:MAG: YHS domain-containing (seleno)protein [Gammaproteobacteria bacterium]
MLVSFLRVVFALTAIGVSTGPAQIAYAEATSVDPINAENGVALKGYDPVAYFSSGRPTEGANEYSLRWNGVVYRFASQQNLDAFKANPEKYAPQYGGYCAYAMSLNRIADIDPTKWAVVEGKLYLNNGLIAQSLWSLNPAANIKSADSNWPLYPKKSAANAGQ